MTYTEYLIRISAALAAIYLFYRLVLHRLTFYRSNRTFLLAGSLAAVALPFVNINLWFAKAAPITVLYHLPPGQWMPRPVVKSALDISPGEWLLIVLAAGFLILAAWRLMQFVSFRKMHREAVLLFRSGGTAVYHTSSSNGAFSAGRSIYVNPVLYTDEELQRIIEHEIVHVREHHTADLVVIELICLLNWYNPFAWMLRQVIRRNLEFIADHQVLQSGHDKKAYQYLLLKAVGIPHYAIVNHFNLKDIKKRIMMMNRSQTRRIQLVRFILALPVLALLLFAFRRQGELVIITKNVYDKSQPVTTDTIPADTSRLFVVGRPIQEKPSLNKQGYSLWLTADNKEKLVVVRNAQQQFLKAVTLQYWNDNKTTMEKKYGKLPTDPIPSDLLMVPGKDAISVKSSDGTTMTAKTIEIEMADRRDTLKLLSAVDPSEIARVPANDANVTTTDPQAVLYILDGVKQPASFDIKSMPPETIESITVLKNKAAQRAKGGVVLITSKKPQMLQLLAPDSTREK